MKTFKFLLITATISFLLSSCFGDGGLICRRSHGQSVLETYEPNAFNSVTLMMDAEVFLTQGDEYKVEVEASDNIQEIISVKVNGKELSLKLQTGKCIRGKSNVKFYVTCPNLEGVELAGSGNLSSSSAFAGSGLDVKIAGSGNIDLKDLTYEQMFVTIAGSGNINMDNIEANDFESKISGSGNVDVTNLKAQYVDLEIVGSGNLTLSGSEIVALNGQISGSGRLKASDLPAKSVIFKISGSGDAYVHAIDDLDVNISGSGNLYYLGRPRINIKMDGSGKLISQN